MAVVVAIFGLFWAQIAAPTQLKPLTNHLLDYPHAIPALVFERGIYRANVSHSHPVATMPTKLKDWLNSYLPKPLEIMCTTNDERGFCGGVNERQARYGGYAGGGTGSNSNAFIGSDAEKAGQLAAIIASNKGASIEVIKNAIKAAGLEVPAVIPTKTPPATATTTTTAPTQSAAYIAQYGTEVGRYGYVYADGSVAGTTKVADGSLRVLALGDTQSAAARNSQVVASQVSAMSDQEILKSTGSSCTTNCQDAVSAAVTTILANSAVFDTAVKAEIIATQQQNSQAQEAYQAKIQAFLSPTTDLKTLAGCDPAHPGECRDLTAESYLRGLVTDSATLHELLSTRDINIANYKKDLELVARYADASISDKQLAADICHNDFQCITRMNRDTYLANNLVNKSLAAQAKQQLAQNQMVAKYLTTTSTQLSQEYCRGISSDRCKYLLDGGLLKDIGISAEKALELNQQKQANYAIGRYELGQTGNSTSTAIDTQAIYQTEYLACMTNTQGRGDCEAIANQQTKKKLSQAAPVNYQTEYDLAFKTCRSSPANSIDQCQQYAQKTATKLTNNSQTGATYVPQLEELYLASTCNALGGANCNNVDESLTSLSAYTNDPEITLINIQNQKNKIYQNSMSQERIAFTLQNMDPANYDRLAGDPNTDWVAQETALNELRQDFGTNIVLGWNNFTAGRFKRGNDLLMSQYQNCSRGDIFSCDYIGTDFGSTAIKGALIQGGDAAFVVTTAVALPLAPSAGAFLGTGFGIASSTQMIGTATDACTQAPGSEACHTAIAIATISVAGTGLGLANSLVGVAEAGATLSLAQKAIVAGNIGTEALGAVTFGKMAYEACGENSTSLDCTSGILMAAASFGKLASTNFGLVAKLAQIEGKLGTVALTGGSALQGIHTASAITFGISACSKLFEGPANIDTMSMCAMGISGAVQDPLVAKLTGPKTPTPVTPNTAAGERIASAAELSQLKLAEAKVEVSRWQKVVDGTSGKNQEIPLENLARAQSALDALTPIAEVAKAPTQSDPIIPAKPKTVFEIISETLFGKPKETVKIVDRKIELNEKYKEVVETLGSAQEKSGTKVFDKNGGSILVAETTKTTAGKEVTTFKFNEKIAERAGLTDGHLTVLNEVLAEYQGQFEKQLGFDPNLGIRGQQAEYIISGLEAFGKNGTTGSLFGALPGLGKTEVIIPMMNYLHASMTRDAQFILFPDAKLMSPWISIDGTGKNVRNTELISFFENKFGEGSVLILEPGQTLPVESVIKKARIVVTTRDAAFDLQKVEGFGSKSLQDSSQALREKWAESYKFVDESHKTTNVFELFRRSSTTEKISQITDANIFKDAIKSVQEFSAIKEAINSRKNGQPIDVSLTSDGKSGEYSTAREAKILNELLEHNKSLFTEVESLRNRKVSESNLKETRSLIDQFVDANYRKTPAHKQFAAELTIVNKLADLLAAVPGKNYGLAKTNGEFSVAPKESSNFTGRTYSSLAEQLLYNTVGVEILKGVKEIPPNTKINLDNLTVSRGGSETTYARLMLEGKGFAMFTGTPELMSKLYKIAYGIELKVFSKPAFETLSERFIASTENGIFTSITDQFIARVNESVSKRNQVYVFMDKTSNNVATLDKLTSNFREGETVFGVKANGEMIQGVVENGKFRQTKSFNTKAELELAQNKVKIYKKFYEDGAITGVDTPNDVATGRVVGICNGCDQTTISQGIARFRPSAQGENAPMDIIYLDAPSSLKNASKGELFLDLTKSSGINEATNMAIAEVNFKEILLKTSVDLTIERVLAQTKDGFIGSLLDGGLRSKVEAIQKEWKNINEYSWRLENADYTPEQKLAKTLKQVKGIMESLDLAIGKNTLARAEFNASAGRYKDLSIGFKDVLTVKPLSDKPSLADIVELINNTSGELKNSTITFKERGATQETILASAQEAVANATTPSLLSRLTTTIKSWLSPRNATTQAPQIDTSLTPATRAQLLSSTNLIQTGLSLIPRALVSQTPAQQTLTLAQNKLSAIQNSLNLGNYVSEEDQVNAHAAVQQAEFLVKYGYPLTLPILDNETVLDIFNTPGSEMGFYQKDGEVLEFRNIDGQITVTEKGSVRDITLLEALSLLPQPGTIDLATRGTQNLDRTTYRLSPPLASTHSTFLTTTTFGTKVAGQLVTMLDPTSQSSQPLNSQTTKLGLHAGQAVRSLLSPATLPSGVRKYADSIGVPYSQIELVNTTTGTGGHKFYQIRVNSAYEIGIDENGVGWGGGVQLTANNTPNTNTSTSLGEVKTIDEFILYLYARQEKTGQLPQLYTYDDETDVWRANLQVPIVDLIQKFLFKSNDFFLFDGNNYVSLRNVFEKAFFADKDSLEIYRSASEGTTNIHLLTLIRNLLINNGINQLPTAMQAIKLQVINENNEWILKIPEKSLNRLTIDKLEDSLNDISTGFIQHSLIANNEEIVVDNKYTYTVTLIPGSEPVFTLVKSNKKTRTPEEKEVWIKSQRQQAIDLAQKTGGEYIEYSGESNLLGAIIYPSHLHDGQIYYRGIRALNELALDNQSSQLLRDTRGKEVGIYVNRREILPVSQELKQIGIELAHNPTWENYEKLLSQAPAELRENMQLAYDWAKELQADDPTRTLSSIFDQIHLRSAEGNIGSTPYLSLFEHINNTIEKNYNPLNYATSSELAGTDQLNGLIIANVKDEDIHVPESNYGERGEVYAKGVLERSDIVAVLVGVALENNDVTTKELQDLNTLVLSRLKPQTTRASDCSFCSVRIDEALKRTAGNTTQAIRSALTYHNDHTFTPRGLFIQSTLNAALYERLGDLTSDRTYYDQALSHLSRARAQLNDVKSALEVGPEIIAPDVNQFDPATQNLLLSLPISGTPKWDNSATFESNLVAVRTALETKRAATKPSFWTRYLTHPLFSLYLSLNRTYGNLIGRGENDTQLLPQPIIHNQTTLQNKEEEYLKNKEAKYTHIRSFYEDSSTSDAGYLKSMNNYIGTTKIKPAGQAKVTKRGLDQIRKNVKPEIDRLFNNKEKRKNPIKHAIITLQKNRYIDLLKQALEEGDLNKELTLSQIQLLVERNIHTLAYQDFVATENTLGDHGLRHLVEHNIRVAEQVLDLARSHFSLQYQVKAIDYLIAHQIMVDHDMGYATEAVRDGVNADATKGKDSGHNVLAAKIIRERTQGGTDPLSQVFGADGIARIHQGVLTHDSSSVDLTQSSSLAVESAIHLADNTHAFETKLPELLYSYPEAIVSLRLLKAAGETGDTQLFEEIKQNLANTILDREDIGEDDRLSLLKAIQTLNKDSYAFTVGRIMGKNLKLSFDQKEKKIVVPVQESGPHKDIVALFDRNSYDQLAKFIADIMGIKKSEALTRLDNDEVNFKGDSVIIQAVIGEEFKDQDLSPYQKVVEELTKNDQDFVNYILEDKEQQNFLKDLDVKLKDAKDKPTSLSDIINSRSFKIITLALKNGETIVFTNLNGSLTYTKHSDEADTSVISKFVAPEDLEYYLRDLDITTVNIDGTNLPSDSYTIQPTTLDPQVILDIEQKITNFKKYRSKLIRNYLTKKSSTTTSRTRDTNLQGLSIGSRIGNSILDLLQAPKPISDARKVRMIAKESSYLARQGGLLKRIYANPRSSYQIYEQKMQEYINPGPLAESKTIEEVHDRAYFEAQRLLGGQGKRNHPVKLKIMTNYIDLYLSKVKEAINSREISLTGKNGITMAEIQSLIIEEIDSLAYQDYIDSFNLLGEHGLRQLDYNIKTTFRLLDLAKSNGARITALDYLKALKIQSTYNLGLTNPLISAGINNGRYGVETGYPAISSKLLREQLEQNPKHPLAKLFPADLEFIHQSIVSDDNFAPNINSSSVNDVINSAVYLSHMTNIFDANRLPELIFSQPSSLKTMRLLKSIGEIYDPTSLTYQTQVEKIKQMLIADINANSLLNPDDREAMIKAAKLLDPSQWTHNIGRIGGKTPTFSLDAHGTLHITAEVSSKHSKISQFFNQKGYVKLASLISKITGEKEEQVLVQMDNDVDHFGNDNIIIEAVKTPDEISSGKTDFQTAVDKILLQDQALSDYNRRDNLLAIGQKVAEEKLVEYPSSSKANLKKIKKARITLLNEYLLSIPEPTIENAASPITTRSPILTKFRISLIRNIVSVLHSLGFFNVLPAPLQETISIIQSNFSNLITWLEAIPPTTVRIYESLTSATITTKQSVVMKISEKNYIHAQIPNAPELFKLYQESESTFKDHQKEQKNYIKPVKLAKAKSHDELKNIAYSEATRLLGSKERRNNPAKLEQLKSYIDLYLLKMKEANQLTVPEIQPLLIDNLHTILYQDSVDLENTLSDHGLSRITYNLNVATHILDLAKAAGTQIDAVDYLVAMEIVINQDVALTNKLLRDGINSGKYSLNKGRGALSALILREKLERTRNNPLGKLYTSDQINLIHQVILDNSHPSIDLNSTVPMIIKASIFVANTSNTTNPPELTTAYPKSIETMLLLKSIGDFLDPKSAKYRELSQKVKSDLVNQIMQDDTITKSDQSALVLAANQLNSSQWEYIVGRLGGEPPTFAYDGTTNILTINANISPAQDQVNQLFGRSNHPQIVKLIYDFTGLDQDIIRDRLARQVPEFKGDGFTLHLNYVNDQTTADHTIISEAIKIYSQQDQQLAKNKPTYANVQKRIKLIEDFLHK